MDTRLRVVLVDDHGVFRSGVRAEIAEFVDIVAEAGSVAEAITVITAQRPDVVLLDVHLPDGSGAAVVAAVLPGLPQTRFLALSVSDAAEDVIAVIRSGARGYVTKTISGPDLLDAIRRVGADDVVFSPRLAGFVLDAFRDGPAGGAGSGPATSDGSSGQDDELDQLSPREQEVLRLLARGYTYREIGSQLFISVKTVESHASKVLRKLQLSSRHQLTKWAADRRML
jgi:DNA-binding NarL/FixJ family response regulator